MRILVALDRTDLAEIVLQHGLDEAARHEGADLDIVTFVPHTLDMEAARTWLDTLVRMDLDAFDISGTLTLHVLTGDPVAGIAGLARDMAIDLLVIGRFQDPSRADAIRALVDQIDCPTLEVGTEGTVAQPQCRACRIERRASGGEHLFCAEHSGGRLPDHFLGTSLPVHGRGLW